MDMRWWLILSAIAPLFLVAGCGPVNVNLVSELDEPPLFKRIEARVGTAYSIEARNAVTRVPAAGYVKFGEASVARFRQVFAAMFAHTEELTYWPPPRHGARAVDGVIELQVAELSVGIGDDEKRPDRVLVAYRVCVYEPTGKEIQCWMRFASQERQRRPLECFPVLGECLKPMVEAASRAAIAALMLAVERDEAVRAWAARVAPSRERK